MITRGSKFFYAGAAFAYLSALFYGFLTSASASGGVRTVVTDGGIVDAVVGPLSLGWKGGGRGPRRLQHPVGARCGDGRARRVHDGVPRR